MDLKQCALDWAERNSTPGANGRDELYEMLIAIQATAYEAGYLAALESRDAKKEDRTDAKQKK